MKGSLGGTTEKVPSSGSGTEQPHGREGENSILHCSTEERQVRGNYFLLSQAPEAPEGLIVL